jgi:hypothetical protein
MKKFLTILVLVVVAIAIGAYFFLFGKKDVCKNVIPEDAKAVLVVDAKQALKQMDFSISDLFKALKHKKESDEKSGWGIDMLTPMYGFVSADNYLCGVFALSNAADFEEKLKGENITVESQRGFKWANQGEIMLCFDAEKALALGPVNKAESDAIRGKMVEWMKQGSHKTPVLSSLKKIDGVIAMRSSLDLIPKQYLGSYLGNFVDVGFENIFLNAILNVREKSFLLTTELESEDEKFTSYMSDFDKMLRPIDGDDLPSYIDEPMMCLVLNVDGENLLAKLRKNPMARMALMGLSLCLDTDMMIKAIDGDVIVEAVGRSASLPAFVANARIKNKDFLKNAKDWCSGSSALGYSCQAFDDKNFVLQNGRQKFFFGVQNDFLYLSSDGKSSQVEKNISLDQIHGKRLYASVDIDKMFNFLYGSHTEADDSHADLDHFNLSVTDFKHLQFEMTTKENTTDFIKKLLK